MLTPLDPMYCVKCKKEWYGTEPLCNKCREAKEQKVPSPKPPTVPRIITEEELESSRISLGICHAVIGLLAMGLSFAQGMLTIAIWQMTKLEGTFWGNEASSMTIVLFLLSSWNMFVAISRTTTSVSLFRDKCKSYNAGLEIMFDLINFFTCPLFFFAFGASVYYGMQYTDNLRSQQPKPALP